MLDYMHYDGDGGIIGGIASLVLMGIGILAFISNVVAEIVESIRSKQARKEAEKRFYGPGGN